MAMNANPPPPGPHYTQRPNTEVLRTLQQVVTVVEEAGAVLLNRFSYSARPSNASELMNAIRSNDEASMAVLRPGLTQIRPQAGWADESDHGPLPLGEWWVVDSTEGNINHVHGNPNWGVSATLVRDNQAQLCVVHIPVTKETFTAIQGAEALRNSARVRPSKKTEIAVAIVGTGQAAPGEHASIHRQLTDSVRAMLGHALVVRVGVPSTFPIIAVATGEADMFWQYGQVRSGLMAGALMVEGAGGVVMDSSGRPWTLDSTDFVAVTPGLVNAAIDVFASIKVQGVVA